MPTAPTPWYQGIMIIGGTQFPVHPRPRITLPPNWIVPPIIGNYAAVNYGEGLTEPVVEFNFAVRDYSTVNNATQPSVLSSGFLNLFHTRSSDVARNTSALSGGIQFWTGRSGWQLNGAKADSYTIGTSKGDQIRFSARFCGADFSALGSAPSFTQWDKTRVLTFKAANWSGGLNNLVWTWDMSYSNNHAGDMALTGLTTPAAQNAGQPTGGLQLTVQEADNGSVPANDASAAFVITGVNGGGKTLTMTLNSLLDMTPNDITQDMPVVMRTHQYQLLAATGQGDIADFTSTF